MANRETLVVPDTLSDQRFADNPMVTGGPRVRFYAGEPLILPDGSCVGTVCLIDTRPREIDEARLQLLRDIGALVQRELLLTDASLADEPDPCRRKEHRRLREPHDSPVAPWRRWGPYVSERSWGTVREDYSADGNAWDYFPHDMARSQGLPLGRGRPRGHLRPLPDPGLRASRCGTAAIRSSRSGSSASCPSEGNHGEDVKEYYFYLDSTPTHSYMK